MKYYLLIFTTAICLCSCNNNNDHSKHHGDMKARLDSLRTELLHTDMAFSQVSEEKGRNAAFLQYAADDATLLRPFSMPATGIDTIKALFGRHPDSLYTLTWMPIQADVARSGDIGYTYGTYRLVVKNIGTEDGTYCTVWKREKGKSWKFVLDTGNEGLKKEDKAANEAIKAEVKKEKEKAGKK